MGDLPDIIGSISIGTRDGAPALVFSGPEVPGLSGVTTTMVISYDSERRRVQVRAGLTGDDSMLVDLASLPEEWRNLVEGKAGTRPSTVSLPVPSCAALQNGSGGYILYSEYQRMVRMANAPPVGFSPGPIDIFSPDVMRRAVMSVLYPPLTRGMFDQLVARCRTRQYFGR